MKRKQFLAILMAAVIAVTCFSGCGAKSEAMTNGTQSDKLYGGLYDGADVSVSEAPEMSSKPTASDSTVNQKLVRTMSINAETDDLDSLMAQIDSKIRSLGGYMENKSLRNGGSTSSRRYRYANMTIRIPAEKLDEFMDHINGASNVIYYDENADDITLRYVATQSRVIALETEQQRLLELLAKAENMSDLLQIEERLTNVRTELEEVTSQMRLFDNMVDYGTVNLSITEVQEYTVVQEQNVWQKIGSGLTENWKNLCVGAENIFVFLVTSLPYTIPLGAVVVIAVLTVKRAKRKNKKKETLPETKEEN